MEHSRLIVWPWVGFAFVGKVVIGWMELLVFATVAMEFVTGVDFVLEADFEEEVDLVVPLGFVVPLDFVVPQCSENLAVRTAQYAEVLLWRLLPSADMTHEAAAFGDTPHLNRQFVAAVHVGANTISHALLAENLHPSWRALIRAAIATSH